ncbi:MAG TPA: sigma-70 family RNA polymerase sigma factor [Vicinamibacterales bacterium]|jgi:RNA polymerase sigma factor (TIGR02999 family)
MDITRLLARWSDGDAAALAELMPLVYAELRKLADAQMRRERAGHTLQPTALVNEAYLRLAGHRAGFENRVHFYGAAAQAMRRILVDHARKSRAAKRGSRDEHVDLDRAAEVGIDVHMDLVALDDALARLEAVAPKPAKVVELRYFGGLSIDETAALLDVAPATVKRHWSFARAWLFRAMRGQSPT